MALSHAILAALHNRPCSGYDLAKKFDGSVGFFWNASHQQIYRELAKLEENGHIEATFVQQTSRPDKKNYEITKNGAEYLQVWITQPSASSPTKDELLVKLFAGDLVSPEVILQVVKHYQFQHQNTLNTFKIIEQEIFSNPAEFDISQHYQYLTLKKGLHMEQACLAWCEEAITAIESITNKKNAITQAQDMEAKNHH